MKITKSMLLWMLFFSLPLLAIPKPDRTNLPIPPNLSESDKALVYHALQLQVYQDAEDQNKYYYIPPFHFKQYREGASSMTLNKANIQNYAFAATALKTLNTLRQTYIKEELDRLTKNIEKEEAKVEKVNEALTLAEQEYDAALASGNKELIEVRKARIDRHLTNLTEANLKLEKAQLKYDEAKTAVQENKFLLPPGMGRSFFQTAIHHIALTGAKLDISSGDEPVLVEKTINSKLGEIGGGDGGFISANAYGGFTRKQREAISTYRTKFFPQVKVALLPLEKLSFSPLAEWQKDPNREKHASTAMLSSIQGSGDYLGITITMNMTIIGSAGLAANLGPFIPPIGIKGTLKEKIHPVSATLKCDFTSGYDITGRTDVRDGAIIYDNDITTTLVGKDIGDGGCKLDVKSGDVGSAHIKGLQEIEKVFQNIGLTRTTLAKDEKEAYLKKVQDDVANNRRSSGSRYGGIFSALTNLGFGGIVIPLLQHAADFHWHTNIQDVHKLSTLKFTRSIQLNGHEIVEREMPTDLCLIYNKAVNGYDRCSPKEENAALTMSKSINVAQESPTCAALPDPFACGEKRLESGELANRTPTEWAKDDELPINF